ncbi:MAG TPA: SUMF1/EgtB/PvdO family nonheme iron enzyme, partial [bacterium]|nr:SUMF1/EgtB/PvdO family nonheme iron enzyme [bacterium]
DDQPVVEVSWNDAVAFCDGLNAMSGKNYPGMTFRLPTEAEWEYACRAGTRTRFYWGDDLNETQFVDYAWGLENSNLRSHAVGTKLPNALGLFDMSGNVDEWCQDYGYGNYPSGAVVDPRGPQNGPVHVARGGFWSYDTVSCRSAARIDLVPDSRYGSLGFRIVLSRSNTPTPTPTPTPNPQGQTITVPLPNFPTGAQPLEMVLIKAGTFTMGCPTDERGRSGTEWPPHQVTLTKDFYLGRFEVTQAQYQAIMTNNPISRYGIGSNYPVYYVSWFNCATYCNRLSEREGLVPIYNESTWAANWNANGYRLPTEAEWEYACRAGTTTRFSHGDVLECDDECGSCANHDQYMWWCGDINPFGTKEVGTKLPNAWGLYDMHGNVWEWCNDWWEDSSNRGPQVDPKGHDSGSARVVRGGCWDFDARLCRSPVRYAGSSPNVRDYAGGFRVSRTK